MPRVFVHHHFHEDVARVHTAFDFVGTAVTVFLHLFDGEQHIPEEIAVFRAVDTFLNRTRHALFHRGIDVQRVPAHLRMLGGCRFGSFVDDVVSHSSHVHHEEVERHRHHESHHEARRVDRFLAGRPHHTAQFVVGRTAVTDEVLAGGREVTYDAGEDKTAEERGKAYPEALVGEEGERQDAGNGNKNRQRDNDGVEHLVVGTRLNV